MQFVDNWIFPISAAAGHTRQVSGEVKGPNIATLYEDYENSCYSRLSTYSSIKIFGENILENGPEL